MASTDIPLLGEDGFGNLELPARPTRRLSYTVDSEVPADESGYRTFKLKAKDRKVRVKARRGYRYEPVATGAAGD